MCSGAGQTYKRLPNGQIDIGLKSKTTGETIYAGESKKEHYKRVGKMRQKEADELSDRRKALIAQQQAQSVSLQRQMAKQQVGQAKEVARLTNLQNEKIGQIRRRGDSVASSLQILGQGQPVAPSASQTSSRGRKRGARTSKTSVARGSARSRGVNLSI